MVERDKGAKDDEGTKAGGQPKQDRTMSAQERQREEDAKKENQRIAEISAQLPRGSVPIEADKTTYQVESEEDKDTARNRGALDKTTSDDPAPDLQQVAKDNPGVRPNPRKVPRLDEKHRTGSTNTQ